MKRWCWAATLFAGLSWGAAARAQPEMPGPYSVGIWTAPPGSPIPMPDGVYYPEDAPCAGAPVALVHGGGESGAYKVRMAELMASYGLVALLPSFTSLLISPTQAEADALNALLEWAVQQGETDGTPIFGKVDGNRYGVAGHSNGGVAFIAAADNPKIQAIVGWDAVAGLPSAPGFHGPSLHLIADGMNCSGGSTAGYDGAPPPKARATVESSSHCDFNDPESPLCVTFCGTPAYDPAAAAMIERYSVAWMVCLLGHDPAMQAHVDHSAPLAGLKDNAQDGAITCQPAECGSGGATGSGASGAGGEPGAGGSPGVGGSPSGGQGAEDAASDGGCGCRTGGDRRTWPLAMGLLALAACRRRRTCRASIAGC